MPQMGVSVSEGTVVEWCKQVGDLVMYEEALCEISTDKVDTEVPSPAAGRVAEILVSVGQTVVIGTSLARIAVDEVQPDGADPERADAPRRRHSPVAQRIAAAHDVDLDRVGATGRGGRVRKQDVLDYVERRDHQNASGPVPTESSSREDPSAPDTHTARPPVASAALAGAADALYVPPSAQPLSRMRRLIGEHMKRSLDTAATCTTWIEVDFSRVEEARRRLGVTALSIVARCTIDTLGRFPSLNAWLDGDEYTLHTEVNLGIAVSLGEDGLVVPVIRSAQHLSVEGLASRVRDLARRARGRKLSADDVQAGTFTLTNPGQYGSIMATPVINQPQVAILDIEAIVKRPVVVTDQDRGDSIAIRPVCILGLSWDHRALDGALAAQFLGGIKQSIESWQ